jgi:hypothetical protein
MNEALMNSAAPITELLGLKPEQLLALELHEFVRVLEGLDRKPDATEIKLGHDITQRIAQVLICHMHHRTEELRKAQSPQQARSAPTLVPRARNVSLGTTTREIAETLPPGAREVNYMRRKQIEKRLHWDRKPPSFWTAIELTGALKPFQKANSTSGTVFYENANAEQYIARMREEQRSAA